MMRYHLYFTINFNAIIIINDNNYKKKKRGKEIMSFCTLLMERENDCQGFI